MPRRLPPRLLRLLVTACACLLPAAVAQAAPPNDSSTSPQAVTVNGTSLTIFQDVTVQATDWGDATIGPEDADPLPSCANSAGFRSLWYSLSVREATVLRVTVASTDLARYQPVVSVTDAGTHEEVGCGLANDARPGATANATAYVTPDALGNPRLYLIRVAQVSNSSPSGGLPTLTVRFATRDVTAPHIMVRADSKAPGLLSSYSAVDTEENASGLNLATARWEFSDVRADGSKITRYRDGVMTARYRWTGSGSRTVVFRISDFAGNEAEYTFQALVQDTRRPDIRFSLKPPEPGNRRMRITMRVSESVRVRLVMTQVGKRGPLLRRTVKFWGAGTHPRSVPLRGIVGKGLLIVSGVARDLAGNASILPQCVIDPVTGQGSCTSP